MRSLVRFDVVDRMWPEQLAAPVQGFFSRPFFRSLGLLVLILWGVPACIQPPTPPSEPPVPRGVKSVSATESPPEGTLYQQSWAVVIGINTYRDRRIPALQYAVNDAQSVATALGPLGFPHDQVFLLLDAQATKAAIEAVLYERLRGMSTDDRLLVFFAGHGETQSLPHGGKEGFLITQDADLDKLPQTALSMEDVKRISNRIAAKHVLFAVDACYSGFAITRALPAGRMTPAELKLVAGERAVQVLTAGKTGEQVSEVNGHGIFTNKFLQGLKGFADENHDGVITAHELVAFVANRVITETNAQQHPQFSQLVGEGLFLFVLPAPPGAMASPTTPLGLRQDTEQLQPLTLPSPQATSSVTGTSPYAPLPLGLTGRRGVLGLQLLSVTPERAQAGGLASAKGAFVHKVIKGEAAERAGLAPGDIIVEFKGQEAENDAHLVRMVGETPAGTSVGVGVIRDGKLHRVTVILDTMSAASEQIFIGDQYVNGQGVAKDEAEAARWYRKAAAQGDATAQGLLGLMYEKGQGVAKDEAEAVRWYRKAADQGDATAQNNLGRMYANGRGVAKDEAEAVRWYRKAADQGDAIAQYNLGRMYANGRGVAKDEAEAVRWYRKAADQAQ